MLLAGAYVFAQDRSVFTVATAMSEAEQKALEFTDSGPKERAALDKWLTKYTFRILKAWNDSEKRVGGCRRQPLAEVAT